MNRLQSPPPAQEPVPFTPEGLSRVAASVEVAARLFDGSAKAFRDKDEELEARIVALEKLVDR